MRTLAVASAGGHLQEMLALLPRIADPAATFFATYDVEQARGLLRDSARISVHHPTTKHVPNAVRNFRLAKRILDEHEFDQVISTGAGVAVPFLLRANQLGLPCHYIESATRTDGPSLTGRILQRRRGIHLYRQLGDWGAPRWHPGPSVLDGFVPEAVEAHRVQRVVVSLGTHRFGFPALVERLAACFRGSTIQVLWQLGSTRDPGGLPGRVEATLPSDEMEAAITRADAVVGHAGVGLTLAALRSGTVPVIVPRRRSRREHTDDHQVQMARELSRLGLAIHAEVGTLTLRHLEKSTSQCATYEPSGPFTLHT